jgi:20S proteasome subunit beta 4
LAEALRKGPYQTNILLGGYDKKGASMYYMDYLGSLQKVDKAAQGYAAYFTLGLMDKEWHPNMTVAQAVALIKKCIHELNTRFIVGQPEFIFKIVDANGAREINPEDFV